MLSFFPTPYPDEWWYSVLCRYHVKSGNEKFQTTIRELFQGKPRTMIGAFFPNNTIYQICEQLPPSFTIKKLILEHTPFLYYMRMYTVQQKENFLEALCKGEATTPTYIWKTAGGKNQPLRYCPLCAQEERDRYGESYWHTLHQLPLVTACDIHHCRLLNASSEALRLNGGVHTVPAENPQVEPIDKASVELLLGKISNEYLTADFSVSPTQNHNNLAQTLMNKGYVVLKKGGIISLDAERIYSDLQEFYGKEPVKRIFGEEASAYTLNRIVKWNLSSPERYIMLQGLAGLTTETVFSEKAMPDQMRVRLEAFQTTGVLYGRKQLAGQLGVKPHQLDILARNYGVEPFWKGSKGSQPRTEMLKLYLTEEELLTIRNRAKEMGFPHTSDYVKFCIHQQMNVDKSTLKE